MLVSCNAVTRAFHKILPFHSFGTNTIDDDMHMNVTGAIVSIGVGADKCLMTGKVLGGKFQSHALCFFSRKSVFLFVLWIEAEDIVVGFDFVLFRILMKLLIRLFAGTGKFKRIT